MLAALGFLAEGVVDEDEGGHGFDHGDGAGEDAGVVASAAFEGGVMQADVHGVLLVHDSGDGFERDAEINQLAIGDATLDSTGTIGRGSHFAGLHSKGVIVLQTGEEDAAEAGANIESLRGGQA